MQTWCLFVWTHFPQVAVKLPALSAATLTNCLACSSLLGKDSRAKTSKQQLPIGRAATLAAGERMLTEDAHKEVFQCWQATGDSHTWTCERDCLSWRHLSRARLASPGSTICPPANDRIRSDMLKEVALAGAAEEFAGRDTHTRGRRQTRRCLHIPSSGSDSATLPKAVQISRLLWELICIMEYWGRLRPR